MNQEEILDSLFQAWLQKEQSNYDHQTILRLGNIATKHEV